MSLASPAGSWERTRLQEWLNFPGSEIHVGAVPLLSTPVLPQQATEYSRERLFKRFDYVEGILAKKRVSVHHAWMAPISVVRPAWLAGHVGLHKARWAETCRAGGAASRSFQPLVYDLHEWTSRGRSTIMIVMVIMVCDMITEVSAVSFRQNLGEMLTQVQYRHDSIVINKDGKPVAALVDAELFARIRRMRDRFDALSQRIAGAYGEVPLEAGLAEIDAAVKQERRRKR
jgi:prevent-host-death family protein